MTREPEHRAAWCALHQARDLWVQHNNSWRHEHNWKREEASNKRKIEMLKYTNNNCNRVSFVNVVITVAHIENGTYRERAVRSKLLSTHVLLLLTAGLLGGPAGRRPNDVVWKIRPCPGKLTWRAIACGDRVVCNKNVGARRGMMTGINRKS